MSAVEPKECQLKDGNVVVIRTAVPDDAVAVLEHAKAILTEDLFNVTTIGEFEVTEEQERQWLGDIYDNPGHIALLAEVSGELAGFAYCQNNARKRVGHVGTLHMGVASGFRGNGVGSCLLEALIDWANANCVIEKLCLNVFADNEKAMSMYEKLGFVEYGRRIDEIKIGPGKYVDDIMMGRFTRG